MAACIVIKQSLKNFALDAEWGITIFSGRFWRSMRKETLANVVKAMWRTVFSSHPCWRGPGVRQRTQSIPDIMLLFALQKGQSNQNVWKRAHRSLVPSKFRS
jgi:hypothetical protein